MNREKVKPAVKTKIPGPNTQKWVDFHMKNAAESTYDKRFVWDRAAPAIGPYCTDPDGNVILDFASHVAANPLGYNNPELLKLAQAVAKIDPDRYAGTDFIGAFGASPNGIKIPTPSHLHEKILEITKPFGFKKAFFVNSGSEAVENAVKLCFGFRKNNGYGIHFDGSFHGRTIGALSLSTSKTVHKSWFPQIPKIISIQYYSENAFPSFKGRHKNHCNSLEMVLDAKKGLVRPEEVAFIIIEPIQGEGGYIFPDPKFLKNVGDIAKEHSIPLIVDEVQTGLGRTGKWWAAEHFGIYPDIITAGKALRIGATIGRGKFFPKEPGRLGSTWGEGNAMASALAYKTIEIIQKKKLRTNARKMGDYMREQLSKLARKYPDIEEVRGLGLLIAFEFRSAALRDEFREKALHKGLLLMGCGFKSVRVLPPLDVGKREIVQALEIIEAVLSDM